MNDMTLETRSVVAGCLVYPPKITVALHSIMAAVGYVQKKGRNDFQKYNYAGEANLLEVLRPAMVEAGLLLIPSGEHLSPVDEFGNVFVTMHYTLAHKDGDVWPEKIVVFGAGNDKNSKGGVGDKGLYKAITGANKYLLFKLFQIETGDDPERDSEHDKDGSKPVKGAPQEPAQPKSPPGISKAKQWVREELREVHACNDGDELLAHLDGVKAKYLRICMQYPQEWTGDEEFSGLKGSLQQTANELLCAQDVRNWLMSIEAEVKAPMAAE